MEKPSVIKDFEKPSKPKKIKKKHVLMNFQVEPELRSAANKKSKITSITISEFLRKCTIAFIENKDIESQTEKLLKYTVKKALK